MSHEVHGIDLQQALPIVVGAHPRAEIEHRPLAYALRDQICAWLAVHDHAALVPLVCTDVWYLNDKPLSARPTISIGAPGLSALGAFLADKLPSAFVIDDVLMVQLDPTFAELRASCWGVDSRATAAAVEAFQQRYLEEFLESAASR